MGGYWFTQEVHAVLVSAKAYAAARKAERVEVKDLLSAIGVQSIPQARRVLGTWGIAEEDLPSLFPSQPLAHEPDSLAGITFAPELKKILELMMQLAEPRGEGHLGTGHLVAALVVSGHSLADPLRAATGAPAANAWLRGLGKGDLAGESLSADAARSGGGPLLVLQFIPHRIRERLISESDPEPPHSA